MFLFLFPGPLAMVMVAVGGFSCRGSLVERGMDVGGCPENWMYTKDTFHHLFVTRPSKSW